MLKNFNDNQENRRNNNEESQLYVRADERTPLLPPANSLGPTPPSAREEKAEGRKNSPQQEERSISSSGVRFYPPRLESEWPKPRRSGASGLSEEENSLVGWHTIFLLGVLASTGGFSYFLAPNLVFYEDPIYSWCFLFFSILLVHQLNIFLELFCLKTLTLASGTKIWKIYYYSQAFQTILAYFLTYLYIYFIHSPSSSSWIFSSFFPFPQPLGKFPFYSPIMKLLGFLMIAILIRQLITIHLTYIIHEDRYSQKIHDLYWKARILHRLADEKAFFPLGENPTALKQEEIENSKGKTKKKLKNNPPFAGVSPPGGRWSFNYFVNQFRVWNSSIADDLPGGTGREFLATEKLAQESGKWIFNNIDRWHRGKIGLEEFYAFFPPETAVRAFKTFFPPGKTKIPGSGENGGNQNDNMENGENAMNNAGGDEEKGKEPPLPFNTKRLQALQIARQQESSGDHTIDGKFFVPPPTASANKKNATTVKKKKIVKKAASVTPGREISAPPVLENIQAQEPAEVAILEVQNVKIARELSGEVESAIPLDSLLAEVPPRSSLEDAEVGPSTSITIGELIDSHANTQESHLRTLFLTPESFIARLVFFAQNREKLSTQLRGLDGLSDVMNSLTGMIFWFIISLLCIIFFDSHIQPLMMTLSTLILSMTFIFSETLKNIFKSIIFIFSIKPYSVGDRINIGKMKYRVVSIQLLTTTFKDLGNRLHIVPNAMMSGKTIQNLTRSGHWMMKISLKISLDTGNEKLSKLRDFLIEYIRSRPEEWKINLSMHITGIQLESNSLQLSIMIPHLSDYTETIQWKRSKTEFLAFLRESILLLGIHWKSAPQLIQYSSDSRQGENRKSLETGDGQNKENKKINHPQEEEQAPGRTLEESPPSKKILGIAESNKNDGD